VTDIEITKGLKAVTNRGRQLQALSHLKPDVPVKVDTARRRSRTISRADAPPRTRRFECLLRQQPQISYREDLVSSGVVIKTEALTKVYEMGCGEMHA